MSGSTSWRCTATERGGSRTPRRRGSVVAPTPFSFVDSGKVLLIADPVRSRLRARSTFSGRPRMTTPTLLLFTLALLSQTAAGTHLVVVMNDAEEWTASESFDVVPPMAETTAP